MSKQKKKLLIASCTLIIVFVFLWKNSPDEHRDLSERERFVLIMRDGLKYLMQQWKYPASAKRCQFWKDLPTKTNPVYFACHPEYLKCLVGESGIQFMSKGKSYKLESKHQRLNLPLIQVSSATSHQRYGHIMHLGVEGTPDFLAIRFENGCSDAFLPQQKYSAGVAAEKNEGMVFDNRNRNIFIDRYLVSRWDINEWVQTESIDLSRETEIRFDSQNKFLPITGLSPLRMRQFCSFRGKKVLQSHYLDAASFFPLQKEKYPRFLRRQEYPFSKRKEESFLFRSREFEDDRFINESNCSIAFTSECRKKFLYRPLSLGKESWMGIYQVLGGVLEYVENPNQAKNNIFPSSFYFDSKSLAHQLGQRISWDEEGNGPKSFEWGRFRPDIEEEYQIGFRCMRELRQ